MERTEMEKGKKEQRKYTASNVGHDLVRCLIAGVLVSSIAAAVGALLGLLFYGDDVFLPPLQGVVSALMLVGSLSMLCSAFFFARWRRKEGSGMSKFWNSKFRCFSYQAGFLAISVFVLALGCILDVVLRALM